MKASKRDGKKPVLTDEEIFQYIHQKELEDGDVIELGPTTSGQAGLFERMRANITPGEVLKNTFDQAVKKRCKIAYEGKQMPPIVDEATFDADVLRIQNFTPQEAEEFDSLICRARMETRAPEGGIYVSRDRAAGFGSDVFGIAYEGVSELWAVTNECGLHAHCAENLMFDIESVQAVTKKKFDPEILSGFIFQIPGFKTPIMTPFGYYYISPKGIRKIVEDLHSWKRFIIIAKVEISRRKYRYGQLFTPDFAEKAVCQD